jgi:hypothetical protein
LRSRGVGGGSIFDSRVGNILLVEAVMTGVLTVME